MGAPAELEAREVEWPFARDRKIRAFAYNGKVPGPLIKAKVGDTVEVRLTNSLPQATTIHWHGVRVPAHMDGTEAVQPPVEPGGAFEYRFVVPDAGTFWYHSHTNETEQLERGLYGGLVVRDPGEPAFDAERVLILDDLKLDAEGEVAPFGDEHEHHAGREVEVRLLNGPLEPELEIPAGTIERWRIVDAANTRYVRLSIGGRPFEVIGTDGGLLPRPRSATDVLLTPGERFDLAVRPFEEGARLATRAGRFQRPLGRSTRSWKRMSSRPGRSVSRRSCTRAIISAPIPSGSGSCRFGGSGTRRARTIPSISMASSSRSFRRTAGLPPKLRGKTRSTCPGKARRGSPGFRMIVPASGCTTATSSSTTRWG